MHLLRIVLPDQPGMLGAVASALGNANGDIVAVDVVERQGDGHAVDDFLVELPLGGRADELVSACQAVPGVRVVWLSRYGAGSDLRRDLEAVEAMTAEPESAERVLVDLAPGVFRGNWAMLLRRDPEPGQPGPNGRIGRVEVRYATSAAPDLPADDVPWVPVATPTRLEIPPEWEEHGWRHVAGAAVPAGGKQVLVLGRTGGPPILDSELARLGHLASLARTIRRTRARD